MLTIPATPGLISTPNLVNRFLDHSPTPMVTVEGVEHIVGYANLAFCQLIDKSAEQLLGEPLCELLPNLDNCATLLTRVYDSGKPESHIEEQQSKPYPIFWSYTIWPVIADNRTVGAVVEVTEGSHLSELTLAMNEALILGSVRQHELNEAANILNAQLHEEIRERKHAEDALQETQTRLVYHAGALEELVTERTSELTMTNQQLEAFVYSIAHDLRAPLRAIQGFSELLMEQVGATLNDAGKGYADRISKSAQFMDAMLQDLLEFSRISQQRVELIAVDLETVVAAVISRLQASIEENNAKVENPGPWPRVLAHECTLVQVLANLTSNALKFAEPGVTSLVRLRAEERADFIRVWVEDNGIGIAADHQDQIFGVFTRLNPKKYVGTGIGLAIVRQGIERMGGRVGVESIPHQGSRFWFELRKA